MGNKKSAGLKDQAAGGGNYFLQNQLKALSLYATDGTLLVPRFTTTYMLRSFAMANFLSSEGLNTGSTS